MKRVLIIIIIFCNSVSLSCSQIRNDKIIFRFNEESNNIVKLKYCGIDTSPHLKGKKGKIVLDLENENVFPGDGIKYFKIEKDNGIKVLKITAKKEDPIIFLTNLKINSYHYAALIVDMKITSPLRKQIFGRIFWNSNIDSQYSINKSAPLHTNITNDYQRIRINLKNNLDFLGQINNLVIHPLFDIVDVKKKNKNINTEQYGISQINSGQALCNKELDEEITITIKSIDFIQINRKLMNREVSFEGHDFNALFLPPLSQITYSLVVPQNNPTLLFSVYTPYWSYGVDLNIFIENDRKTKIYHYKQRGFRYKDCSNQIEVDLTQHAGKKVNLTFSISSFSNKDLIFLRNPVIAEKRPKNYPNIVLVMSDALRADHISCYNYNRSTSPNIDVLAKNGVIFSNNISQAPSTRASHASLFTGKLPLDTGIEDLNNKGKLEESALTIAEILRDKGYLTFGLYANPHINHKNGFSQGFDDYFYYIYGKVKRGWGGVKNSVRIGTEEAIKLIEKNKGFPFFLFLYYADPHTPYNPPEESNIFLNPANYKEPFYYPRPTAVKFFTNREFGKLTQQDLQIMTDLYDGEIFNLDKHFGIFMEALKKMNLAENTIIVFTSDHGEAFGERRGTRGHGQMHYYEQCHVPLIISYPGKIKEGQIYRKITGNIDIVPTLLTLIGKTYSKQEFLGIPLFTESGKLNKYDGRHIHVETSNKKGIHSVYNDDYLLIYKILKQEGSLFKYKEDRENMNDLKDKEPEIFKNLVNKISIKIEKRD